MARKIGVVFLLIALVFVFLGGKPALAVENEVEGVIGMPAAIEEAGGLESGIIQRVTGGKGEIPVNQPQFTIRACPANYENLLKTMSWVVAATSLKLTIDYLSDLEVGKKIIGTGASLGFDFDLITDLLIKWQNALFWGLAASVSLFLSGWLWEAGLALNMTLLEDNVLVTEGFPIMLSIANIGFILILIAAALLTILGLSDFKGWNIGSIMPRLVAAILLVNFSQFFANIILQASTALMNAFLGNQCIGRDLFNFFNMGALHAQISNFLFGNIGWGSLWGILAFPLTTTIAALLTFTIALTVFFLVIFLFVRYIVVSLLIIFMPIAWLGFAAPGLKMSGLGNPWDMWWKEFLKWMIFGPLIAFSVLLSAHFITAVFEPIADSPNFIKSMLQIAGFVIISFAGLWIANKMSGEGADLIKRAAGSAIGGVQKLGGLAKSRAAQLEEQADRTQDKDEAARLRARAKRLSSVAAGMTSPGWPLKTALSQAKIKLPEESKVDKERIQRLTSRAILGRLHRDSASVLQLKDDEIEAGMKDPTQRTLIKGAMENLVAKFSSLTLNQQRDYGKAIRKMKDRDLVREVALDKGDASAIINLLTSEDYTAINTDPKFAHNRDKISKKLADLIDPEKRTATMDNLISDLMTKIEPMDNLTPKKKEEKIQEIKQTERLRLENRFNAITRKDISRMVFDLLPSQPDVVLSLNPSDLRNFTDSVEQKQIEDFINRSKADPQKQTLLLNRISKLKTSGQWTSYKSDTTNSTADPSKQKTIKSGVKRFKRSIADTQEQTQNDQWIKINNIWVKKQ